tara:strand:+ start:97 stop:783 length:687 start_codon:yes stop_codon:yes gene_type:complete
MSKQENNQQLAETEDLKHILAVLTPKDAEEILALKDELKDNWNKKQIFRTETEMRISVLNDAKHPTPASKYWQSVREQSAHFDAMMGLSFELRKNTVEKLRIEKKLNEAEDELDIMEFQIDLDQNVYGRACMEQVAHDRVREIQTWSKLKSELNDGTFDDQNVNTHQTLSLHKTLQNRVATLNASASPSEVMNALGPLQTVERLKTEDNKLLNFTEAKKTHLLGQKNS